jgi:hypothetical protein
LSNGSRHSPSASSKRHVQRVRDEHREHPDEPPVRAAVMAARENLLEVLGERGVGHHAASSSVVASASPAEDSAVSSVESVGAPVSVAPRSYAAKFSEYSFGLKLFADLSDGERVVAPGVTTIGSPELREVVP